MKTKKVLILRNLVSVILLVIILCIGSYYRILAIKSNITVRNGFETEVSIASYLFVNPAAYKDGSMVKPEYSIYDAFSLKEYYKYTNGTQDFKFVRNPAVDNFTKNKMPKSKSELGWAFILRYILTDGIKGSQNMALRIVKFNFIIELMVITLLFFTGKKIAGFLGGSLAALLYAMFMPAVHMMSYVTYYYWAIPFSIFSLFFWIVLYRDLPFPQYLKRKIFLFFFYGAVMGFATATRIVFLYLPLFLSPFIFWKERKIKTSIVLLAAMLTGQFLLLLPQMIINKNQFGKFAITTRDTWHAIFTGVGMYQNPFGIENSGDIAVYDYIKRTTGVDIYTEGLDSYNNACKIQAIKAIKENPKFFITNAIKNIDGARTVNPVIFYGIDTPIDKSLTLNEIQNSSNKPSVGFIRKYIIWLLFLALIFSYFNSRKTFMMFLLVSAQNIYLILVICLYFPNYLYYMSGYIPAWILWLGISAAIPIRFFYRLLKEYLRHFIGPPSRLVEKML